MLTDNSIKAEVALGSIKFFPEFDESRLGSNSYDFTLNELLLTYAEPLSFKKNHKTEEHIIPPEGLLLIPGRVYLGCTNERVDAGQFYVPMLEGKSSVGRLGVAVHITAGFGDIGFNGHWTLEIVVTEPITIFPNIPIAQVFFHMAVGTCDTPYNDKASAKYVEQPCRPIPSQMYKNFV